MKLTRDLQEFVELLKSNGVEYLIVGAHALAFHGRPRFTGDLDVWVRPTPENAERVLHSLAAFGFAEPALTSSDFVKPGQVVQLGFPPNRIDLLTSITGVDFDLAWANKVHGKLGHSDVCFLGRSDLITNKKALGRLQDLADAESLGEA